ncbi:MAG: NTP transferase domain-containing protein [Nanoarchaeota archaeon]|nr:NTP transferase domain-containing protein [Nanoarchaeota archaeon]MBU1704238.1 NTP transferase domain-containing protein [Nanoarchaeota archaeon]
MKAVILAAGKSTRTYPLTVTKPKPLLKVAGKTLLEYNLDQLTGLVDEVILIVNYKKDMIIDYFKDSYQGIKLTYVDQPEPLGTGHALLQAKDLIQERFILLMGDDLYSKQDIQNCIKHNYCVLAKEVDNPENFGVLELIGKKVKNIVEKPQMFFSNLANCALYVLDEKIFPFIENLRKSKRGEFEITDAIRELARKEDIFYVKATQWTPIGYPWDLFKFKDLLGIKGNAIGNNCKIDGVVENSIIMDNTLVRPGSVVKDSILGDNVTFQGTIHSNENATSIVKKIPRKAGKLGAVIGDDCTLEKVNITTGVKIWPGTKISGIDIKEDVE